MRIDELIVEPGREDHFAQHHVTQEDVQEVAFGNPCVRRSRQGRYPIIGRTAAGRYLTIILAPRGGEVSGLVTARDATQAERREYQAQRRL